MANYLVISLLVVLALLNIIVIGFAAWFYVDFQQCINEQSPYCPQIICPDGQIATRTDKNGNTQQAT